MPASYLWRPQFNTRSVCVICDGQNYTGAASQPILVFTHQLQVILIETFMSHKIYAK